MNAALPIFEKTSHKVCFAAIMAITAAGIAAMALWQGFSRYPLDDAFIVQHSIQGILDGRESRFLDSTPYDGVTSPLFVLLITALSALMPIHAAHWLVQALSALAFVSGAFVLARQKDLSGPLSLAVAAVAAISGMTVYQLFNGLETGMAMAAVTWTIAALESDKPPKPAFALAGLLCFVRPELAALSGLAFLHFLRLRPHERPEGWKSGLIIAFGAFGCFAIVWTILSGSPIPNTVSAKQYFFADGCLPASIRMKMLGLVILSFISVYGMPSIGFLFVSKAKKCSAVLLLFAAVFLAAYFLKSPGAIARNGQRYMYVLAPAAVLGNACVIRYFLDKPSGPLKRFAFSWGLIAVLALHSLAKMPERLDFIQTENSVYTDDNKLTAAWLEAHVPAGSRVLIHDAGMSSLIGTHPLVDLVGLKTRYSIEAHRSITWKTCGENLGGALADIALKFGTSYAVIEELFDRESLLTASFEKEGWSLEPLSDGGEAGSRYRVYRLHSPDPGAANEANPAEKPGNASAADSQEIKTETGRRSSDDGAALEKQALPEGEAAEK